MNSKKLIEILLEPGTEREEKIYATDMKRNEDGTYTFVVEKDSKSWENVMCSIE